MYVSLFHLSISLFFLLELIFELFVLVYNPHTCSTYYNMFVLSKKQAGSVPSEIFQPVVYSILIKENHNLKPI
jgi:hypothetical protein